MKALTLVAALAVPSILAGLAHSQSDMIGFGSDARMFAIESSTGDAFATTPFPTFPAASGMARGSNGSYYVVAGSLGPGVVYSVDPCNGEATELWNPMINQVLSLASRPSDDLLFCTVNGGPLTEDLLYTLDPTTQSVALVGSMGHTGVRGLAFTPDGRLWGWDATYAGLIEVDPLTGWSVDVNGFISATGGDIQFLSSDDAGNLFGGRSQLWSLDVDTGFETLIGGLGMQDIRGAEFFTGTSSATNYCTGKVNSQGCVPTISGHCALPSAGQYYPIRVESVINQKVGVIIYGGASSATPFQGGFLCVAAPIQRTGVQPTNGYPIASQPGCSGRMKIDMNALGLTPGATYYFQGWSRDPWSPSGTSLTGGLAVVNQ